jgi:hypothetical protein
MNTMWIEAETMTADEPARAALAGFQAGGGEGDAGRVSAREVAEEQAAEIEGAFGDRWEW